MMWKGANIEVVDLGTNVAPEAFVAAAREHRGHRSWASRRLLTTTMVGMRDVVAAVRAADLPGVKVIVGGAPVTAEYAASIGADGYAPDAGSAVDVAKAAVGHGRRSRADRAGTPRTTMRHRDRVIAALGREVPDRCPMQISFTPEFAERLRDDLVGRGLLSDPGRRAQRATGPARASTTRTAAATPTSWSGPSTRTSSSRRSAGPTATTRKASEYVDEWGVLWRSQPYETRFGTGRYTEMVGHPLADDAAIASYVPPDPQRDSLYADADARPPRLPRRVLHRRGHRHDDLGDGLGAARLRPSSSSTWSPTRS